MAKNVTHINDDLLVKYLLGEASPEESFQVQEWINSATEHQTHFQQLKTIWEKSKLLAETAHIDENEAWQVFKQRVALKENKENNTSKVVSILSGSNWLRIAAVFVFATVAVWLLLQQISDKDTVNLASIQSGTAVIKDTLMDGSIITINKNSLVTYPKKFDSKTRPVQLKGEAFFKVAHDKKKPFIVYTNDIDILVVGTEFNVKAYDSSTEITVESGIVKVTRNNESVTLIKGEQLLLKPGGSMQKQKISDHLYDFYRTRKIVCNGTSLTQLVQWLNVLYESDINIGNPSLNALAINTTFDNENLDNIIMIIQQTFNLTVVRTGGKIVFYPGENY